MTVSVSGLAQGRQVYVIAGQAATFRGTVKPFVAGQTVTVTIFRGHKAVGLRHAKVLKGGAFTAVVRAPKSGVYAVQVNHAASAAQAAGRSPRVRFQTLNGSAHEGSSGVNVQLLQKGLAQLGYVTGRGGHFDAATGRAVLAFRKVNGMSRITSANGVVFAKVFAGQGGFRLRYPHAGKHVEFDWSRQVLVLANHGRARADLPRVVGQAVDPDGVRLVQLLLEDARHERQGHGRLELLHRGLRDPRLSRGADLRGEPRLHPRADPGRELDLQLDRARRPDLRLPLGGRLSAR